VLNHRELYCEKKGHHQDVSVGAKEPEVEQDEVAPEKDVANEDPSEAFRGLLHTRLVREREPPIRVVDIENSAGDVEMKGVVSHRMVSVLDDTFPLGVRRFLE